MNYGFVKVGAFTKKVKVGDVDFNKNQIIDAVKDASGKIAYTRAYFVDELA